MNLKALRLILVCGGFVLLSGGLGYKLGISRVSSASGPTVVTNTAVPKEKSIDFSLFWLVWDKLSRNYIDKSAIDAQKMVYGAISGMVSALNDPYTIFLTPEENKDAKDELGGQFEGIGAQLGLKDKRIIVIAPLAGSPAKNAGVKAGDWIIKVDKNEIVGWSLQKVVSKIRGSRGSNVTLTLLHEGDEKPVEVTIVRDTIHVASAEWEKKNVACSMQHGACTIEKEPCNNCVRVAVLKLTRFGDTTTTEWDKAVSEIVNEHCSTTNLGCKGVVLDMRNNPGGYLQGSVYIASEFLPDGTVVSQQNSDGSKQTYTVNRKGKLLNVPLVVLVNKGSASASEIVAGALKVRGRAKLVGETTFGKGSVQNTEELPNGAGLHITVARWHLPDDSTINGKGVEPNVIIDSSQKDTKEEDRDIPLEKAVEVLTTP